jgi:RNA polymerase sigma-70 factor (ECF subfamily)
MQFPTTHWSALAVATVHGEGEAREALEQLCRSYWGPVRAFIRSRGVSETDAEDLTQDFFAHVVEKSIFTRADRLRGRFRSFLIGALIRFLRDAAQERLALKRGGGIPHVSLDAAPAQPDLEPLADEPENLTSFDREWALTIMERALATVRAEYAQGGREKNYAVLKDFLPRGSESRSYEGAAHELGVSVAAFKSELHRLRSHLRALVQQQVAQTVSAPHEVASEMDYLQKVLMDKASQSGSPTETSAS